MGVNVNALEDGENAYVHAIAEWVNHIIYSIYKNKIIIKTLCLTNSVNPISIFGNRNLRKAWRYFYIITADIIVILRWLSVYDVKNSYFSYISNFLYQYIVSFLM